MKHPLDARINAALAEFFADAGADGAETGC